MLALVAERLERGFDLCSLADRTCWVSGRRRDVMGRQSQIYDKGLEKWKIT